MLLEEKSDSSWPDNFDYDAYIRPEFEESFPEDDKQEERMMSIVSSLPANVASAVFCVLFWGVLIIGVKKAADCFDALTHKSDPVQTWIDEENDTVRKLFTPDEK